MPKITEVKAEVRVSSRVQLVKFELSSEVSMSLGGTWSVDDLSEADAESFRQQMMIKLRQEIEPAIQQEIDDLFEQKAQLGG